MASPNSISTLLLIFFFLFLASESNAIPGKRNRDQYKPCKSFTFYFHDIVYNGKNAKNATSTIIATPVWGNKLEFSKLHRFGDLVVFDDPITLDNNLHSKPIGRAQGLYLYNSKDIFTAWISFTFVFTSKELNGTLVFDGADPLMAAKRDISVVGGTGDFFMTRGTATLVTDSAENPVYFRLRVDVKLYECW